MAHRQNARIDYQDRNQKPGRPRSPRKYRGERPEGLSSIDVLLSLKGRARLIPTGSPSPEKGAAASAPLNRRSVRAVAQMPTNAARGGHTRAAGAPKDRVPADSSIPEIRVMMSAVRPVPTSTIGAGESSACTERCMVSHSAAFAPDESKGRLTFSPRRVCELGNGRCSCFHCFLNGPTRAKGIKGVAARHEAPPPPPQG